MDKQVLDIKGMKFNIPDYYQQVESMPDDPENSVPLMVKTPNAMCFVLAMPIKFEQAMPLDKQVVIDSIHGFLGENQGLIQVESGNDFVFSIVKNLKEETGVQYILTYQRFYKDKVLNIQGYFDEIGMTGMRDSMVYAMCRNEKLVGTDEDPFVGWNKDPYTEGYTKGSLMNISEEERFDDQFPGFPLTMCREFVRTLQEK